jgi:hypothetical protein
MSCIPHRLATTNCEKVVFEKRQIALHPATPEQGRKMPAAPDNPQCHIREGHPSNVLLLHGHPVPASATCNTGNLRDASSVPNQPSPCP